MAPFFSFCTPFFMAKGRTNGLVFGILDSGLGSTLPGFGIWDSGLGIRARITFSSSFSA